MADLVVDGLEVVEIEDDERKPTAVAMRARDLPAEGLVEEPPVVEPGQCIEIGELASLPEATGVVDRRAGPFREILERATIAVREGVRGRPAEDRHEPDRRV